MTKKLFAATGRRKTAVARVTMKEGDGKFLVNGRTFEEYFPTVTLQNNVLQALHLTGLANKFDIKVAANGGGAQGQAGAVRLGIARILQEFNLEFRPLLKKKGLLTRDPRMRERKKPGRPGARKRFQFSKR